MQIKITVLPGDGIGPEVTKEATNVLEAIAKKFGHTLDVGYEKIGGEAITEFNDPLPASYARILLREWRCIARSRRLARL